MTEATRFLLGIDLGSTTNKGVLIDVRSGEQIWREYERHEGRSAEKLLAQLLVLERDPGIAPGNCRVFATGTGSSMIAPVLGARFVQEVHAACLAVTPRHPRARSIVDLGGQDAKIIVFRDAEGGRLRKLPAMNDKCAGGTGAVLDRIAAKLNIRSSALATERYTGVRTHPIAGKCGVFAETDITGLLKQGIPPAELIASLFDAIVLQNLSVLTRGYALQPHVVLLGGPHAFVPGIADAWRRRLDELWLERGISRPEGARIEELVFVPPDAQYYGALGALAFAVTAEPGDGAYAGSDGLREMIRAQRGGARTRGAATALVASDEERRAFLAQYTPRQFVPPRFRCGETVQAFLGLDAGSTSTKGVLLGAAGQVLTKAYLLSLGNPIEDAVAIVRLLRQPIETAGAHLQILGVGTTGYAKDILRDVLQADVAIAETVAHTEAAKQQYDDPHVIVDVGGQDIKLIFLKDGRVKDFRLNTQCSAGNGYFLQSVAESFGVPVERYAELAFSARTMPQFGYGCAVFLQSDIAASLRHGATKQEVLAGLAAVLPKNVFQYVARVPDLARLGTRFVLQGGTQRNLAAVKAQVDFIRESFGRSAAHPEIAVHEHAGECGAIGAALEAARVVDPACGSRFVGLASLEAIRYETLRGEETRCGYCRNRCIRTFIDITVNGGARRRVVVATCERGAQQDAAALRAVSAAEARTRSENPDFVDLAGRDVWRPQRPPVVADTPGHLGVLRRSREIRRAARPGLRVGIPRVLNLYTYAPLFSAYLESLGLDPRNLVYSDFTSAELYRAGAGRGSIDPCFPSKVAIAHVHNLLGVKHKRRPLDCVFMPMLDVLDSPLVGTLAQNACPTVVLTPRTVWAAFTKESDAFAAAGVAYLDPLLNLADRQLFEVQMQDTWGPLLGLSRTENARAVAAGFAALEAFWAGIRARARVALDRLERERRLGIVVLGRPYHHDPGINHGILEELRKRGYTIFSQATLPRDDDLLERLFGDEVRAGVVTHPLDISDVWKQSTSENTNQKIWAAKFVARHPSLVALEFSSFKCGHDAPVYSVIEEIVEAAGRPYLAFKDLDENQAAGAIKLRVETIDYFLKRYREDAADERLRRARVEAQLSVLEDRLRRSPDACEVCP